MHALVPKLADTGFIRSMDGELVVIELDVSQVKDKIKDGSYVVLTGDKWKSNPKQTSKYIYRLKSWVRNGDRKMVISARKIRTDSTVGPEFTILKRVNGQEI